jgi:hypothetical protein
VLPTVLKRWTHCINRKGTILKGITTINKVKCIFRYRLSRGTSWYAFTLQCPLCFVRCYQSYNGSAMPRKFPQYKNSWNSFQRYSIWSCERTQVLRREANAPEKEGKQGVQYRTQSLLSYCTDSSFYGIHLTVLFNFISVNILLLKYRFWIR